MTDEREREREAEARWGATDAYRQSQRRWESYTEEDKATLSAESEKIVADMAAVMSEGATPDSEAARAVAERHRLHIHRWFYDCDHWMHAQVAEMYVYDDRFKAFYEERAEGLATFFSSAVEANTLVEAGEVQVSSALEGIKTAAGLRAVPPATADLVEESVTAEEQVVAARTRSKDES